MTTKRVAQVLLAGAATGLAVTGVVFSPTVTLVVAVAVLGLLAAVCGWCVDIARRQAADPEGPVAGVDVARSMLTGLTAGIGTSMVVLVLAGVAFVIGPATVPLVVLTALATLPWVLPRVRPHLGRGPAERHDREHEPVEPDPGQGPRPLVRVLDTLSTPALCAEWQRSLRSLVDAPDAATRHDVAELRRRYFDELERRDPDAVARWLAIESHPAGANPARHLSPARGPRDPTQNG